MEQNYLLCNYINEKSIVENNDDNDGAILVFVSGVVEISKACESIKRLWNNNKKELLS